METEIVQCHVVSRSPFSNNHGVEIMDDANGEKQNVVRTWWREGITLVNTENSLTAQD